MDFGTLLGGIGGVLGGLSSVGGSIYGAINAGKATPQQKLEKQQWERMRTPSNLAFGSIFYTPQISGKRAPYSEDIRDAHYNWTPTPALQNLYSYYLGRQYGVPESIARAQAAQAMGPMRLGSLGDIGSTQQAAAAVTGPKPAELAQALLQSRVPGVNRQLDILSGAADIAAFNLYRSQLLPQLIG